MPRQLAIGENRRFMPAFWRAVFQMSKIKNKADISFTKQVQNLCWNWGTTVRCHLSNEMSSWDTVCFFNWIYKIYSIVLKNTSVPVPQNSAIDIFLGIVRLWKMYGKCISHFHLPVSIGRLRSSKSVLCSSSVTLPLYFYNKGYIVNSAEHLSHIWFSIWRIWCPSIKLRQITFLGIVRGPNWQKKSYFKAVSDQLDYQSQDYQSLNWIIKDALSHL